MRFFTTLFEHLKGVKKAGLIVNHTVDHINSTLKGKSVSAHLSVQSTAGWFSTDYTDPATVRRHADWIVQVAGEMRKMASKMEEPPK